MFWRASIIVLWFDKVFVVEVAKGPWFFKENEDGVFVKENDTRIKIKKGNLMEGVLDVQNGKGRDYAQHVLLRSLCLSLFLL